MKYVPVSNFGDFAGNFGNCRLEGNVDFKGGKKPEPLLEMILKYYSNPGDLVLDSFVGSGTTAAVAHKMGRRYIGVEMGDHAYSHCKSRLDRVIMNQDTSGITKSANWQGGGGYRFKDFGKETITRSPHLEKLCLISPLVGRDKISDFTTNFTKKYLLKYTETFATTYLEENHRTPRRKEQQMVRRS